MNTFAQPAGEKDIERLEKRVRRLYGLTRINRDQHDNALDLIERLRKVLAPETTTEIAPNS